MTSYYPLSGAEESRLIHQDVELAPAAHQERTELDRQVEEYKAKADRGEAVSTSDLRWLLNELIYERDQRGPR